MADNKKILAILIPIILVIALIAYVVAEQNDTDTAPVTNNNSSQQQTDSTEQTEESMLAQVTENPADYYGQEITVTGEIRDLYSSRVFAISDQLIGDELLVVTPSALSAEQLQEAEPLFEDNAEVTATGTLRQIIVADIEREYGFDVPSNIEAEYENRAVLVADNFNFSDSGNIFEFTVGNTEPAEQ